MEHPTICFHTKVIGDLLRKFMDLDKYERITKFQPYLKQYLDINRFSMALKYRLAGDTKTAKMYQSKIDKKNLTQKQKKMLRMPVFMLQALWRLKKVLEKLNIRVSAFS